MQTPHVDVSQAVTGTLGPVVTKMPVARPDDRTLQSEANKIVAARRAQERAKQLAQERADEKVREAAAAKAARAASANAVAYRARVAQRIHSFQQYPEGARQRGVEGTSTVAFTLNASGAVTTARLAKSGGDAELDGEAIAAVRRASPFPAPPAGVAHTFVAPFSYRLK